MHPQLAIVWLLIILLKGIVLTLVIRARRRSNFFLAYIIVSLLKSITLITLSYFDQGWPYTYVDWIGTGLLHGLAFATAYDCFRQLLPNSATWPFRKLPLSFAYALMVFVSMLTILVICMHVLFPGMTGDLGANLLRIDRTETWWICGLMWLISSASDWLGIPWRARPYGIFLGFLFTYSIDVFVTAIRAFTHWQLAPVFWPIGFITELICLLIWAFYFTRKEPELTSPNPDQLAEIQRILARFFAKPDPRGSPDDAA